MPTLSIAIFIVALVATLVAAVLGRRHSRDMPSAALSEHRLNRWLVGLSAGATANSGFVVTAAVGLGYSGGAHWLLLPLAWLLGDIIFWIFFPQRINASGRAIRATTMTDVIVVGVAPTVRARLKRAIAVFVIICLGGYVAAQWLAGQKFLGGAFHFNDTASLLAFAGLIVFYTAIGGFRGSVYVDSMQAVMRVGGTILALGVVTDVLMHNETEFWRNIHAAGPDFLKMLPHGMILPALPIIIGFAAAALGFGLGQPQMVTRYLAGATPNETQAAWPAYLFFVQFTWISMTVFGVLLRGVMPAIPDPEMGLSILFRTHAGAILTGLISADIFAAIASTSNSLLVAMAQSASRDLFGSLRLGDANQLWPLTALLGAATMLVSLNLHGTVFSIALSSVSLLGAGLGPAMLVCLLHWRRTDLSLALSVAAGFGTAVLWLALGFNATMNEAAPGIAAALAVHFLMTKLAPRPATSRYATRSA